MGFFTRSPKKYSITSEDIPYRLGDMEITLTLRHNPRAKRISLKLNRKGDGLILVMARKSDKVPALKFLETQSQWALNHLQKFDPPILFEEGGAIPYLGQNFEICHNPDKRFGVEFIEDKIWVAGPKEHLARRLRDYIKKQAKDDISALAHIKAASLDKVPGRITIRDQRSRWGSCSAQGNLSFSWRLMLAPSTVLDYVVGHEVAHLVEMNHSPDFWNVVDKIVENPQKSRRWLKQNGPDLHRIG